MARTAFASINAAATSTQDVPVGGSEFLTVIAQVGPTATATGDVTLTVQAYRDDDTKGIGTRTLAAIALPTVESVAAVLVGNLAITFARYRVSGLSRVQLQLKNNNVAALPGELNYDLG